MSRAVACAGRDAFIGCEEGGRWAFQACFGPTANKSLGTGGFCAYSFFMV